MKPIDISSRDLAAVRCILREHVPEFEVRAFGSRVSWSARDTSDLDLVLMTVEPLPVGRMVEMKEAFTESDLPFKVDIIDWATTKERFRRIIEKQYEVVQGGKKKSLDTQGEWREVALEDVALDVTVGHVGPMASEYVERGIPFLRTQNVAPLRINDTDLKFITEEFGERLRKSALSPGDVVIVPTGKPGACAVIPERLPVANCSDLVIVRCGSELEPRFLAYYVNSVAVHHVNSHLVGAVQQHFNVGSARKMIMRLPPLPEQRAIAHILGTLDDKIELNRRMNETLEAMARALFKSWFVDFDLVRAKMEGRDPGLPKPLADLFPNRLVGSELGEIPVGWEVKQIGDVVRIVGGGTPNTKIPAYWSGRYFRTTPKDLSDLSSPVLLSTERTITEEGLAQISSGLLPAGTLLLSSRAPVGYLAISEVPLAINQGYIAVPPDNPLGNLFMLYWCEANMDRIKSRACGTTFQEISKRNFRPILLVVPTAGIVAQFSNVVAPLFERIVTNVRESRTLAALRDTLLPRLVSGALRIPCAEQIAVKADA